MHHPVDNLKYAHLVARTTRQLTAKRDTYKYWVTVGLTSDALQEPHTLMSVIKSDPGTYFVVFRVKAIAKKWKRECVEINR